jgi:hypothetical protein
VRTGRELLVKWVHKNVVLSLEYNHKVESTKRNKGKKKKKRNKNDMKVSEKQNKKGMKRIFRYTEQLTKKKVTSYISLEGAEA